MLRSQKVYVTFQQAIAFRSHGLDGKTKLDYVMLCAKCLRKLPKAQRTARSLTIEVHIYTKMLFLSDDTTVKKQSEGT